MPRTHIQHQVTVPKELEEEFDKIALTPFLKWAGGKRWLEQYLSTRLPTFNRYIEPFLGSGATYFRLKPKTAVLADLNSELITTYQAIKDDWNKVLGHLKKHHGRHSHSYYYQMRAQKPRSAAGRAARFIYLNRTCWNGLYRVNLRGEFNVPIGTKTNVLLTTDRFDKISELLSSAELLSSDFESVIDRAEENDLIFADPPYTVKHNLNGFVKYNEKLFSWDDQIRLRDALMRAKKRGAHIILTNADHWSIRKLYKTHFQMHSIDRQSVIAASNSNRGICSELLILG